MKKSLVLAMAMALGVTASAYAANPFSDVPAGHWAYDSIDKLAAAGVIDGMGDGTYQGDKTMTRYEMAQIVAKAMAKGANVDKLAAEFADELDNLGVRVANLEKKADNVKISGYFRANTWNGTTATNKKTSHRYRLRSQLDITGQVNEKWAYHGTIRNEQFLASGNAGKGEEETRFMYANVTGRVGGLNVLAGRYGGWFEDGDILDATLDGVEVSYGKAVKLTAGYSQYANNQNVSNYDWVEGTNTTGKKGSDAKIAFARLDTKAGVVGVHASAYKMMDGMGVDNYGVYALGVAAPLTKSLNAHATYFKADNEGVAKKDAGFVVDLNYKGAKAAKAGSFGIYAKYYKLPSTVAVAHTNDLYIDGSFKGYKLGANYAIAKNITTQVDYFNGKSLESGSVKKDMLVGRLQFNF